MLLKVKWYQDSISQQWQLKVGHLGNNDLKPVVSQSFIGTQLSLIYVWPMAAFMQQQQS